MLIIFPSQFIVILAFRESKERVGALNDLVEGSLMITVDICHKNPFVFICLLFFLYWFYLDWRGNVLIAVFHCRLL